MAKKAFLWFDGACRWNGTGSAVAACAYVLTTTTSESSLIHEDGIYLGPFITSNGAEYKGLIAGLRKARTLGIRVVHLVGDSELICNQVLGIYSVKNRRLARYRNTVMDLLDDFDDYSVQSVPSNQNARADQLANDAFSHTINDYSWGMSLALVVGRVPKNAWKYLLQQRIYGHYRIEFLLQVIAQNYPDVFEILESWCFQMDHVDDVLREAGTMTDIIVTA